MGLGYSLTNQADGACFCARLGGLCLGPITLVCDWRMVSHHRHWLYAPYLLHALPQRKFDHLYFVCGTNFGRHLG